MMRTQHLACAALLVLLASAGPGSALAQDSATPEATAESGLEKEGDQLIVIAPRGGFGRYSETTVEQENNLWSAGLTVFWQPDVRNRVLGDLSFGGYDRQYVQVGVGQAGQNPTITEAELRVGGMATYAFNLLADFGMDGWAVIGWRHEYFTNDRFSDTLSGAVLGVDWQYPFLRELAVRVFLDYTYNLASVADPVDETGLSFTGDLLSSLRFGGGLRFNVADVTTVGVMYMGEHLPYDTTDLLFHQAILEVGIPIRF